VQKALVIGKKLLGAVRRGGKKGAGSSSESDLEQRKDHAIADANALIDREGITLESIQEQLPAIKNANQLPKLDLVVNEQNNTFFIQAKRSKVKRIPGKLTKNMPGGSLDNHQAHHLIPFAVARDHKLTREAMRRGIWDVDNGNNGINLPCNEEGKQISPDLPLHSGSHPDWSEMVKNLLDAIVKKLTSNHGNIHSIPSDEITHELNKLQNLLRRRIKRLKGKLS
jgi:hypothetical protein